MNLAEANQALLAVDCRDPEAVSMVLTERSRSLAEFAASASPELLMDALEAGEDFRERLEQAQIEARRELDRMTKLSRGLTSTLDQHRHRVTCFG